MRRAEGQAGAAQEGIAIAREIAAKLRGTVQGIQVSTQSGDIEASLAFMTPEQLNVLNELLGALREGLHKRPSAERAVKAIDARAKSSRRSQLGSRRRRALLDQSDGTIAG